MGLDRGKHSPVKRRTVLWCPKDSVVNYVGRPAHNVYQGAIVQAGDGSHVQRRDLWGTKHCLRVLRIEEPAERALSNKYLQSPDRMNVRTKTSPDGTSHHSQGLRQNTTHLRPRTAVSRPKQFL
jgi:hypothetical protein